MDVNTALIALLAVVLIVQYMRVGDCEERIRAAQTEAARNARHAYREAYAAGLNEGYNDGFDYYSKEGTDEPA